MEGNTITLKKDLLWKITTALFAILFVIALFTGGFGIGGKAIANGGENGGTGGTEKLASFSATGDSICTDDQGRPYVLLFSTTWCPHCVWIKDTFDSLANEDFANQINLQHWELDTGDNLITSEIETEVPAEIGALYQKYNPKGSIPTFVFGCSYMRVGNTYEQQQDLDAELEDFKLVINELLG
ncbi:MAG TPA: thioredoxin family protein [Bacillota bacterium]|nr:thioredoxin family protein [Bacillota bacterium]